MTDSEELVMVPIPRRYMRDVGQFLVNLMLDDLAEKYLVEKKEAV